MQIDHAADDIAFDQLIFCPSITDGGGGGGWGGGGRLLMYCVAGFTVELRRPTGTADIAQGRQQIVREVRSAKAAWSVSPSIFITASWRAADRAFAKVLPASAAILGLSSSGSALRCRNLEKRSRSPKNGKPGSRRERHLSSEPLDRR